MAPLQPSEINILAAASGSRNLQRWYSSRVTKDPGEPKERERAGLCADCSFARRIENPSGSRFYLCERSADDPRFAKYPRLPVLACPGYSSRS